MPRLFGAVIYALGARTVEAQIVVTTILVGTACLALAYFSMRRLADPLFAFIFCALLITDYLQYAQWNVVTYRVWYAFLFYAVVYSIMRCGEKGNRWAAAGRCRNLVRSHYAARLAKAHLHPANRHSASP